MHRCEVHMEEATAKKIKTGIKLGKQKTFVGLILKLKWILE